jgi:hypothetical protein
MRREDQMKIVALVSRHFPHQPNVISTAIYEFALSPAERKSLDAQRFVAR